MLSKEDISYGEEKIAELSKICNISYESSLKVLYNFQKFKEFFKWVKASEFIENEYVTIQPHNQSATAVRR